MTLRDEPAHPRTEHATRAAQIATLKQQLATALVRIATLEQQRHDLPPVVKPNQPKPDEPKRPRKQRASQRHRGRRCETPTRTEHYSDCQYRLRGSSIDDTRQVIELPLPQPVEIVGHQVIKH
jgi:hypothetical protein